MTPIYYIGWRLMRTIARLIFRLKTVNHDRLPDHGPLIIACNHVAYTDPPLAGVSIKRPVHFLAKRELFQSRIFGWILKHCNSHPINRAGFDRRAIRTILDILKNDETVMIFPEGTRARKGVFLPPLPGIGLIAARGDYPVLPVYLHGSNKLSDCFWGREKLVVVFGKVISSSEISGYKKNREGYQKLADDIMERIKALKTEFIGNQASLNERNKA